MAAFLDEEISTYPLVNRPALQAALDPLTGQSLAARNIASPLKRPLLTAANILTVMAAPPA